MGDSVSLNQPNLYVATGEPQLPSFNMETNKGL